MDNFVEGALVSITAWDILLVTKAIIRLDSSSSLQLQESVEGRRRIVAQLIELASPSDHSGRLYICFTRRNHVVFRGSMCILPPSLTYLLNSNGLWSMD